MSYLGNTTGGTPDQRREEADRILKILAEHRGGMTESESKFVAQMRDNRPPVSTRQLFWLRDIKAKYME